MLSSIRSSSVFVEPTHLHLACRCSRNGKAEQGAAEVRMIRSGSGVWRKDGEVTECHATLIVVVGFTSACVTSDAG